MSRLARRAFVRAVGAIAAPAVVVLVACATGPEPKPKPKPAPAPEASSSELVQAPNWWESLPRPGYARLEAAGEYGGWFEVYRLDEQTFAIYEPYQFQEALSYLVLGSERAALVDAGNGIGDIGAVVRALTDLPVSVLLTHEHPDHYGGAAGFDDVALFDDARAVERVEAGVPHERAKGSVTGDQVWKPLPSGVDADTFRVAGTTPTRLLSDGDVIDLGGRRLEVIHTPGHSPGSVCYLDQAHRYLFTGDHFYPGPLYAFGAGVDLEAYVASNDRLAARVDEYDRVLSGHNEPWVAAEVIPRVSEAFRTILDGDADPDGTGDYSEQDGLRRYRFDGFDIIVRRDMLREAR